ncbi:glycosyltransferase [Krasilnikoviella flava]|uniref:glycosyltransferase n=1 Tax=Krasilnikoviella flava TaxID=526729 RepID=UPI001592152E|nr:glycosyltransferase [Krasilnikoviella flava]
MLSLTGLILVVSVALLLPTTGLVLVTGRRRRRRHAEPRPAATVVGVAAGLALAGCALALLLGAPLARAALAAAVVGGSLLVWWPVGRSWAVRGIAAWSMSVLASVSFLVYTATWTLTAEISPASVVASGVLWLVEAFVVLIGLGHLWEFVDVLTRRQWPASVDPRHVAPGTARPFVSLHVPTHDEPPDMVIATLRQLLRQRYDAYEILVIDNNTTDPALWRPVEEFCAAHDRITFLHVENLEGFKSGALNLALRHTDPRADLIGIIDADYLVEPDFLADCAPMFADPGLSFLQTPQDYRDWDVSAYFRRLYYSYSYFFDVSQASRNERNGAIFGGTMGLIRRAALEGQGGWDEWCITEDAELSLRLLRAGGRGVHIDRSYGRGVMPLTFEALKRQRFRWCFGGIQILRMHWRSLLPGRSTARNQLTLAQRWAYLVGGLQWFGDVASVIFTGFLLLGAADAVLGTGTVVRRLSDLLVLCTVVLVLLGLSRAVVLARRSSGARWRDALGAFGLWVALGWVVASASVRGLFAREGVFLRTPKQRGDLSTEYALRANLTELLIGTVALAVGAVAIAQGTTSAVAVGVLLALQGVGFLLAPYNSIAALRSHLPEDLARRRRRGLASWETAWWGGAVAVGAAMAAVIVVTVWPTSLPERPSVPSALEAARVPDDQSLPHTETTEPHDPDPTDDPASTPDDGGTGDDVVPASDGGTTGPTDTPTPSDEPTPTPSPTATDGPGNSTTPTTQPAQAPEPTRASQPTPSNRPTDPQDSRDTPSAKPTAPPGKGA